MFVTVITTPMGEKHPCYHVTKFVQNLRRREKKVGSCFVKCQSPAASTTSLTIVFSVLLKYSVNLFSRQLSVSAYLERTERSAGASKRSEREGESSTALSSSPYRCAFRQRTFSDAA